MKYIITIETTEEETIATLADFAQDATGDFDEHLRINPDYLAIDDPKYATKSDGIEVMFQRVE